MQVQETSDTKMRLHVELCEEHHNPAQNPAQRRITQKQAAGCDEQEDRAQQMGKSVRRRIVRMGLRFHQVERFDHMFVKQGERLPFMHDQADRHADCGENK